jgi:hypothetical protein
MGKPLPADDPWVKGLAQMFPGAPLADVQKFASTFRDNMFRSVGAMIEKMQKKSHEMQQKVKRMILGQE